MTGSVGISSSLLWFLMAVSVVLPRDAAASESGSVAAASKVAVAFLDAEAAKTAIVDDSLEPYFEFLQPMEMSAKTGSAIGEGTLEEQRKECRRRYAAGVREFTDEEKEVIGGYVNQLVPYLVEHYPLFGRTPWSFLKVSNQIEGGLPHTRGKHILLSEARSARLARGKNASSPMGDFGTLILLVHEQMHVFQRLNPGRFDSLYRDVWDFEKADSIEGIDCGWLVEHHLVNPDGVDCRWVFPIAGSESLSHVLPLIVFSEGEGLKHMPRDFQMIAVHLEKKDKTFRVKTDPEGKPVTRELLSVPEYRAALPLSGNIYHPNEAAADYFARFVVLDGFAPDEEPYSAIRNQMEKHLSHVKVWFEKNLRRNKPTTTNERFFETTDGH